MKTEITEIHSLFDCLAEYQDSNLWEVVDVSKTNSIAVDKKTGKVNYIYAIGETVFIFDLLSHVTDTRRPYFDKMIKRNGLTIETIETENDYFEIRVSNGNNIE